MTPKEETQAINRLIDQGYYVSLWRPEETEFNKKYRVYRDQKQTKIILVDKNGQVTRIQR